MPEGQRNKEMGNKSLERRAHVMRFWWGAQRLPKGLAEGIGNEQEVKRSGFMSKAGESARGMFLLSLSMILLLFNLLDGQHDSRY